MPFILCSYSYDYNGESVNRTDRYSNISGFPTAKGTMIAVIGTYIIFVVYNVVSSSGESGKEDVLQARNKSTDKVSINAFL